MNIKYPYLSDADFLKDFDQINLKEQFVKITILTFNTEEPLADIQGHVTGGTISVDGNSSVRRTANLTFVADQEKNDVTDLNNLLSLNKKVRLSVGFTNPTNKYKDYPVLWFPQGIYVIINASLSNSSGGITISLQLKDKMCLLNGECGGVIPAATSFHEYDTIDNQGNTITSQPTIYQIIQEVVNHFGGEQLGRIIISGLDTRIKKVMKWIGSSPLGLVNHQKYTTHIEDYSPLSDNIIQFSTGEDIGYVYTDFFYPSELIGDAGSTVTEILDKIKDTLGNYEYFYDIDGNFIFQEIQNFLNTTQSTTLVSQLLNSAQPYIIDISKGKTLYKFNNKNIVTSYSNTPQYNMIKNDFLVWGVRKDSDGKEFPIRYHLAIDEKPEVGNIYLAIFYEDENDGIEKVAIPKHYSNKDDLPEVGNIDTFYSYLKQTDDEYSISVNRWNDNTNNYEEINDQYDCCFLKTTDWRSELYLQGASAEVYGEDSNYYYTELKNEWTKIYNFRASELDFNNSSNIQLQRTYNKIVEDFFKGSNQTNILTFLPVYEGQFKSEIFSKPTTIDYFLDFIDSGAQIANISVKNIGRRTRVLNDDKINCIFETGIPDYILIKKSQIETATLREECIQKGQKYIQVDAAIYDSITQGGYLNSAYVAIQDLLYQHSGYNENISINCLPVYYLEPNIRIYAEDKQTGIKGDYIISSYTLPLDVVGTMSINATKAIDKV